jgi:hypothetical protein
MPVPLSHIDPLGDVITYVQFGLLHILEQALKTNLGAKNKSSHQDQYAHGIGAQPDPPSSSSSYGYVAFEDGV